MWGYSRSNLHLKRGSRKEGYWEDRDREATCQDKKRTSFGSHTQLLPKRPLAPFTALLFFFKISNLSTAYAVHAADTR